MRQLLFIGVCVWLVIVILAHGLQPYIEQVLWH